VSSFQRLHHWWTQRNRREQAMLAVMFAAIAAFAFWYGMLSPARALREAARRDYSAAVRQLHRVQADASQLQALADQRPADRDALAGLIEQSAAQAGVALSRQRRDSQDQWVVEMDAVDAPALLAWLDRLQAQGVQPVALVAERDGARLRAQATFVPASPRGRP
jgi:general secretion pathway protein M